MKWNQTTDRLWMASSDSWFARIGVRFRPKPVIEKTVIFTLFACLSVKSSIFGVFETMEASNNRSIVSKTPYSKTTYLSS